MSDTLARIRKRLVENHESIKPNPVIGDDESIYLTDYQEGQQWGLAYAVRLIDMAEKGEL